MTTHGSGSFLANAIVRRRQLNKARQLLTLGERGLPAPQRSTPPVVPANRPNRQEEAITQAVQPPTPRATQVPAAPAPPVAPPVVRGPTPRSMEVEGMQFSPEERVELLKQVTPFLENLKNQRRSQIMQGVVRGRSRRFLGGGL